jgi:hypothetical protein
MDTDRFVEGVERLIKPIEVGTLHYMQGFNDMLPTRLQKKIIKKASKATPYMGFVVEPYSYFMCYELRDLERAESYLPEGFKLVKTKIFDDDQPKYYGIFGCFNAHTSGFWGLRVEFYVIAEDETTGMMSWIIVDYDTNTITYDPGSGLSNPNAQDSIMTVDYTGRLLLDIKNDKGRQLRFVSDISRGQSKALDKRLWIEGNLSIAYGTYKSKDDPGKFSLTFDPREFKSALKIEKGDLSISCNDWFPGLFDDEPSQVLCFPYAQHFLSDSPGYSSNIKNEKEMIEKHKKVDFDKIPIFSTEKFKKFSSIILPALVLSNIILALIAFT